ncbi:MAG: hypothetical protein PHE55_17370, partial [Methylococcaceae bacterium]|nr:hypothetical protein [Methylococcaceae bacterium]
MKLANQVRGPVFFIGWIVLALSLSGCEISNKTKHLDNARALHEKSDYRGAIIELKSALQKDSNDRQARALLGELYAELGNGPDAEKELRLAMELGIAREQILPALAKSLLLQEKYQPIIDEIDLPLNLEKAERVKLSLDRGYAWLGMKKIAQAKAEFEMAAGIDGQSTLVKLAQARMAAFDNDLGTAMQMAKQAVEADPKSAEAWSYQGDLFKYMGDIQQAETSYDRAIELRHLNQVDLANRALIRIDMKKFDEARRDIDILQKEAPRFFLTQYAEGVYLYTRQKLLESQAALENSFKLNDKYIYTHYFLGLTHLAQNHLEQADKYLTQFFNEYPASIKGRQMLALTKYNRGEYETARALLLPVIKAGQDDEFVLKLMGSVEIKLKNYPDGLEYLKKLVNLKPKSTDAKIQLGGGYLESNQKALGLAELEA